MNGATLLRPARCARCGVVTRQMFTVGAHYVCAADACLDGVLLDMGVTDAPTRARLLVTLRDAFTTAAAPRRP